MQRYIQLRPLAALGVALALCSNAQSPKVPHAAVAATAPDENTVNQPPTRRLAFTSGDPVSGFKISPNIVLPMQCTRDGALFLDMIEPPTSIQQALYAVTPKSSRAFPLSAISDLHQINLLSFFPGSQHVSLLVHATKEASPLPGEPRVRLSTYHYYIAIFNRQGGYLRSIELDMHGVEPSHLAELPTGEYLITGYDRPNDLPRLYLVADDGQAIRSLVLPYNLARYTPSTDPYSGPGMMNSARVLGSIVMTPHGDEVLVWRRGGGGPILSVGAHGGTREIDLDSPKGMTLADVLPSDKLWVAHFQNATNNPDQPQDNRQMPYYQFNPSNGSLTSKLEIHGDSPEHTPAVIACEEQGTFLGYQTDDKGQTRILSAR